MRKSRFTEEQIIRILEEAKGTSIPELCRKHGICDATYYNWKAKYQGMTVPETRRMRTLEDENSKLKKLVADQALDIVALKDALSRKW